MKNLDYLAMKTAQEISSDEELDSKKAYILSNKILAVLTNDGPFGMLLFLSNEDTTEAKKVKTELLGLASRSLSMISIADNEQDRLVFEKIAELSADLDQYLLLKMVWQKTLTYVRYYLKS